MNEGAALVEARRRAAHEELQALGIVGDAHPVRPTLGPAGDRELPRGARRFAVELKLAQRDLCLGDWWSQWLSRDGSHASGVDRRTLRRLSVTEVRPRAGASVDRALRHDLSTKFMRSVLSRAQERSGLLFDHGVDDRGAPDVADDLEVFLMRTQDAYDDLVGSSSGDRRMAEVYAALATSRGPSVWPDETWAVAQVVGCRTVADWLHVSGSVVYRGRRPEVASFSRFPSRGTDIYLGTTAGRASGLAVLHEGIHAIHHELLYRYADDLDAAFPDTLWLETTAHLVEQMAVGQFHDHVAARSLVFARVHAVRALYARDALEASAGLDPASLSDRLAELYRDHLGAVPPPCDAVTDLFLLDQNLVRARSMTAGATLARTSCGTALAEAESSAELFTAFRAVAAYLGGDGVHVLADERAARSLEPGSRPEGAA